jgi:hypothetical protein
VLTLDPGWEMGKSINESCHILFLKKKEKKKKNFVLTKIRWIDITVEIWTLFINTGTTLFHC